LLDKLDAPSHRDFVPFLKGIAAPLPSSWMGSAGPGKVLSLNEAITLALAVCVESLSF